MDKNTNFLNLLKRLAELQTQILKIEAQMAIKDGKDQINNAVESTKESIKDKSKQMHANFEKAEKVYKKNSADKKGIIENYKEALEEVGRIYNEEFKFGLEEKSRAQEKQLEIIGKQKENKIEQKETRDDYQKEKNRLNKEIKKLMKEEKYEEAKNKVEELNTLRKESPYKKAEKEGEKLKEERKEIKNKIKECEKYFDDVIKGRNNCIEMLKEGKNTELTKIPKQNIFQKAMGAVFGRFNATKKFTKTVMANLEEKIRVIKEEQIPEIAKNIQEKKEKVFNKVGDYKTNVIDKGKDIYNSMKEKVNKTYKSIIDKTNNAKMNIINKIENTIQNKTEELNNKREKLNENNREAPVENQNDKQELKRESLNEIDLDHIFVEEPLDKDEEEITLEPIDPEKEDFFEQEPER